MATAKKTAVDAADSGEQPEAEQPTPVELESDVGGWFINTGQVGLVLLQPATVLEPGQVIELEFDPGHRDLRRATEAQIKAARDAERGAAEVATITGQEQ